MMGALTLVTGPVLEPLTLDEAKEHLRITIDDMDGYINSLIGDVRQEIENMTSRAFITQTWDYFVDCFPGGGGAIEIPRPPLQSVTSVNYVDENGATQTLSTSVYTVDTDSEPGRVYLAFNESWPTVRDIRHAITIRFVAGYGVNPSSVPGPIKRAIRLMVHHRNELRDPVVVSPGIVAVEVPKQVDTLLAPYRRISL